MSDVLRTKRRERVRHGMSTHDYWKGQQKRVAKRALAAELRREQVAPPGPEPEDIAPDPYPDYASWDPNWESIDWDEDDAA